MGGPTQKRKFFLQMCIMGGDYCQTFFIYFIHIKIIMKGGGRIMKGPPS